MGYIPPFVAHEFHFVKGIGVTGACTSDVGYENTVDTSFFHGFEVFDNTFFSDIALYPVPVDGSLDRFGRRLEITLHAVSCKRSDNRQCETCGHAEAFQPIDKLHADLQKIK